MITSPKILKRKGSKPSENEKENRDDILV